MTVVFVIRWIEGGVGTVAWNQARMLAARGRRTIVLYDAYKAPAVPHEEGIRLVPVHGRATARSLAWSLFLRLPLVRRWLHTDALDVESVRLSAGVSATLGGLVGRERIEAVCFSDSFPDSLYWRPTKSCPMVMGLHGPRHMFRALGLSNHRINERHHALVMDTVRRAGVWYAPSRSMQAFAADYYGIARDRIAVVPNPIDTRLFSPRREPRSAVPSLLFVGRFSVEKGADVLIDVIPPLLSSIPDLTFTIAGDSGQDHRGRSLVGALMEKAAALRVADRVTWKQNLPYGRMPALYRASTLVVAPSTFESFSLVCAEAQATGVPVVASAAGGICEVVEDGATGRLVPPGDREALWEAVTELLFDPEGRAVMSRRARERAEATWSYEAVAPQFEALLPAPTRGRTEPGGS